MVNNERHPSLSYGITAANFRNQVVEGQERFSQWEDWFQWSATHNSLQSLLLVRTHNVDFQLKHLCIEPGSCASKLLVEFFLHQTGDAHLVHHVKLVQAGGIGPAGDSDLWTQLRSRPQIGQCGDQGPDYPMCTVCMCTWDPATKTKLEVPPHWQTWRIVTDVYLQLTTRIVIVVLSFFRYVF